MSVARALRTFFSRPLSLRLLGLALAGISGGFAQEAFVPGSVDLGFNPAISSTNRVGSIAAQPDGKVLAVVGVDLAMGSGPYFRGRALVELNKDGSLNARLAGVTGPLDQSRFGTTDYASIDTLDVQPDGTILIAGLFVAVNGLEHHDLARLNPDGSVVASFAPDPGLPVYSQFMPTPAPMITWMLPLPDGRILVTGFLNAMNGQPAPQLAVVRADGSLDSTFAYQPSVVGMVESISNQPFPVARQSDGRMYVAGTPYGGLTGDNSISSNLVVRLNQDGTLDPGFAPVSLLYSPTTFGGSRFMVPGAVQEDGKLLLSGNFAAVNGERATNFARVNSDGSPDPAFNSRISIDGLVQSVLVQSDGRILLGGAFEHVNGAVRRHLARLNTDGTLDTGFNPGAGPNGPVLRMALHETDGVLISGNFDSVDDQARPGLARLHLGELAGSSPVILSQPMSQEVTEGQSARFEVKTVSAAVPSYQWLFNNAPLAGATNAILDLHVVHRFEAGDYAMIVSNAFGSRLSAPAHLAVTPIPVSGIGGVDIDFAAASLATEDPSSRTIRALVVQADGKIITIGPFKSVNGNPAQQLVRLNPDGTLDQGFNLFYKPDSAPFERFELTSALLQPDGRLLVARQNWDSPSPVMRLQTDGTLDPSFSALFTSAQTLAMPSALALQPDGKVVCAGIFTGVNEVPRTNLVRLNMDGSVDPSFIGPELQWWENITTLAVQPNGQILAGVMDHPSQRAHPVLMRLNPNGALDPSFTLRITHTQSYEELNLIAVQPNGVILIGGRFSHVSGIGRDGIARLTADGELDRTFVPPTAEFFGWGYTRARAVVVQPDGKSLWVIERDTLSDPAPQKIVRLNPDGSLDPTFTAALIQNRDSVYPWQVSALALTPEGGLLIGGRFTDVGAVARAAVARLYTLDPGVLQLTVPSWTPTGLRVFATTVHGTSYTLENTPDLRQPWHTVRTFQGQGGVAPILLSIGERQGLFRLRSD